LNDYGIYLFIFSSNNFIYNNYFNNTNNAISDENNIWNIKKTAATNIIGGTYLGGNYWSDYEGKDTDGDGLGDTLLPYNSSGNIQIEGDYHPLVQSGSINETVSIGSATMDINDTIVVPNTIANATNIRQEALDLIPEHGMHSIAKKEKWRDALTKSPETARESKELDMGTGTGFLALMLAEMGHNVTGADWSMSKLKAADEKIKSYDVVAGYAANGRSSKG